MKKVLCILLLICTLIPLAACGGTADKEAKCLKQENGKHILTLPESKKEIALYDQEVRFVPYITDKLVKKAEHKIKKKIPEGSYISGFYLQIADDYLCLAMEILCCGCCDGDEHDPIVYSERISSRAVEEDKDLNVQTDDVQYKKIQFFPSSVLEFSEEKNYDVTEFKWAMLTDDDMRLLRQVYNNGRGWTNDNAVDRMPFYFDGRIRFATEDSVGWMHFGIEQNVLYYNGMFAGMDARVMDIIERVQNEISK